MKKQKLKKQEPTEISIKDATIDQLKVVLFDLDQSAKKIQNDIVYVSKELQERK